MANTTIKITQLPSIGNGLSASTILPVVNTSGTAVTEKVSVGAVANFALTEAGNTLEPAFLSTIAYSVANAAQPNITSVGNLTGLTLTNLANFHVPGGTNGYVLQTDGTGNLSWVAGGGSGNGEVGGSNSQLQFNLNGSFAGDPELTWDAGNNQLNTVNFAASHATIYGNVDTINVNATGNLKPNAIYTDHYYYANGYVFGGGGGNGTPGGATTQVQFNDAGAFGGNTGFTFNKTSGVFTAPFLAGNGNGLSNIQGANISGFVPNANVANTAFAVAGANVSGAVQYAGTANSVAVANVVGIGNIATLALDGSTSNVLYGNGVFAPISGGGNPFDQELNTTDNVEFANVTSTEAIKFSNSGNIVGALGYAPTYVSIEGYQSNSVNITTNDVHTWEFDQYGGITFPGGTIAADDIEGTGNFGFEMPANVGFDILADLGNSEWSFGANGTLTLAGDINAKPSGFPFSDTITNITTGNPTVIVDVSSNVFPAPVTGQVTIFGVIGTSEANDVWYYQAVEANQFQLFSDAACTIPVDGTSWTAYVSGGNAYASQFSSLAISTNGLQVVAGGESWTFDNTGQINLPTESNSFNKGRIQSANGYPTLLGYGSSGEHGGPELDWMDSDDPATAFMNANVLRNTMYINDNGLYVGINENNKANVAVVNWRFTPDGSIYFPTLDVDLHNGGVQSAQTLQFGDNTQQAVITGPTPPVGSGYNAQRLIIQGQRGDGAGEGGDVYFWAGDADTAGGDIKIYAGDADNVSAGYGGYINITGGQGFDGGGDVSITGGRSANSAGAEVRLIGGLGATTGGTANVQGGQGSVAGGVAELKGGYGGGSGGNVNIVGGAAGNGLAEYGNVNINAGASTWTFDNTGSFVFPGGGVTMDGQNNALLTSGLANVTIGTFVQGADGGVNWEYQGDGSGNSSYGAVGLDTGGTANTANLQFKVQLVADQGNASTNKEWLFDTSGNLTLPGNTTVSTNNATGGAAGNSISIVAGAADQSDYYTTAGGNVNITGGLGAGNDGGGGGVGGSVNITAGLSADPVGNAGNVVINTGTASYTFSESALNVTQNPPASPAPTLSGFGLIRAPELNNLTGNVTINANSSIWTFDSTGNLTLPGSIVTSTGQGGNISGANVITANVIVTTPVAFSSLTAVAGARAFINDGNLVSAGGGSFGALVGGGGSNICPVWSDGTNWYIG